MPRRRRETIRDLRTAIDCLPVATRAAMLEGIRSNDIIVGAYTDRRGGVCPMLAAHRCGGRTDFLGFARAWDRFAGAGRRARRATERELLVLRSHLEASLLAEGPNVDFGQALADHRALLASREPAAAPGPRPGEPNRAPELRKRHGWSWLRIFRRLDDYERALARLEAEQAETERERELV